MACLPGVGTAVWWVERVLVVPNSFSLILDSDIIYLNLAGTPVVVVNSVDAAYELFERRSSLYSDRYVAVIYDLQYGLTCVVGSQA